MIYVELSTPAGSVFVNPAHVALIGDGANGVEVTLSCGDQFEVDGTAEIVVEILTSGDQVPF